MTRFGRGVIPACFFYPQMMRLQIQAAAIILPKCKEDSFFLNPKQARTIEFLRRTRWKPQGEMLSDEGVI